VDVGGNEKTAPPHPSPTGIGAPVRPAFSLVAVESMKGGSVFVRVADLQIDAEAMDIIPWLTRG
jgi:hypothetical protein